jgi:hypothetical protein
MGVRHPDEYMANVSVSKALAIADEIKRLRAENERLNAAVSTAPGEKIKAVHDAYARGRQEGLRVARDAVIVLLRSEGQPGYADPVYYEIQVLIDAEPKTGEGDV